MNKVPVGKTISYAYTFTFSEIGSIIGLSWVCLVAAAILQFLPYIGGVSAAANPLQEGPRLIQNFGITILELLLYSIVYVPVTRLALRERQGGAIWHFALGAPEFRVFGATLLFGLVLIGIVLALLIGSVVLGLLAAAFHNKALIAVIGVVIGVAVFCVMVFVSVRLWFVLVPVTVVEERVNLVRAWLLTNGNFWRILAIIVAVLLPVVIAELVVMSFFIGPDWLALYRASHMDQQAMQAGMEHIEAMHAPALIGIALVFAPFQIGLSIGASAFGYRMLTGGEAPANVPAQS